MRKSILVLLFGILTTNQVSISEESEERATKNKREFLMGFTPFPHDFSMEAVQESFDFIGEHSDIIAHHIDNGVPWTEALEDKPFHRNLINDWFDKTEKAPKMKSLLSVTPLNNDRGGLAMYRGEKENMPLPEGFAGKSLNDPDVLKAYLNYCKQAVEHFKPDYFAIGIEVNELMQKNPKEWPNFLELYKHVYAEIKSEHPALPVFATVTLHNLRNSGWNEIEKQQKEIKKFLEINDLAGISYYPFMIGNMDRGDKDLDWLKEFVGDKPIAFCEMGYPAEDIDLKSYNLHLEGSPGAQVKYYETLLKTAQRDHYRFVVSFLHRDYDALWEKIKGSAPEAFLVWKDCGMVNEKGEERPALEVWDRWFKGRDE